MRGEREQGVKYLKKYGHKFPKLMKYNYPQVQEFQ